MNLYKIFSEILLNEISDSAKQKAKEKFKKENPNLTDDILNHYINIFSDRQSSNAFQKKDIMQYKFSELERIVDANFEKTNTSVDINDTDFEGSEDVIYNQNKLLILLGDLKEKCIRYGTGKSWCISRRDTSNMFFSYRMRLEEPVFYFVFDKSKLPIDKHRAIVIYINSKGVYMVANANNEGDKEMTWSQIESIQPKLKGLKDLFKHIPLTKEEREDYKKFKNPVNDSTYENFNYTERLKYIGFGHDLTEEQIRMTWNIPNQKALISKYVTTGFGTNLPKDIESKLSPSDRAKNTAARKEYIKQELELTDPQFESCSDELKREYIKKGWEITDSQFEMCSVELKRYYVEEQIKQELELTDPQFEFCSDELKRLYVEMIIKKGWEITDSQFEMCSDELKRELIKSMIKMGLSINDSQFESCSDELKRFYVENITKMGRFITDLQFELCSDELKIEYVKFKIKMGRNITDRQFKLCSDELKIKYIEKIIENGRDMYATDSQFEWCSDELKRLYVEMIIKKGWEITDRQFKLCSDELKRYYVEEQIKLRRIITDRQFEMCSDELKRYYVEEQIKLGRIITNPQFEMCSDELKREHIKSMIKMGRNITNPQFEMCSDELKRYYVEEQIKLGRNITNPQFEWCPDELKREHIKSMIKMGLNINDSQFEMCSDELKIKYIEKIIENGRDMYATDSQFEWCPDELKIKFFENVIKRSVGFDHIKFKLCSDELKRWYIEKLIENRRGIDDINFEICSDKLKRYYIEKKIEKEQYISNPQKRWARENNLMESTNFSPPPHETATYKKIMRSNKKIESNEQTMADSSGSFEGPLVDKPIKRKISKIPNMSEHEMETTEQLGGGGGFDYDAPAFGKTPKGGRKNPMSIEGEKSVKNSRAVTDKNFPKWGGPDSVFIKVKEKCKKFPYCNQGDINAIEPLKEAIEYSAKKYKIPVSEVEKMVLNKIIEIFN